MQENIRECFQIREISSADDSQYTVIDAPVVFCAPKQIDLQAFLLLQLPYCVSVLLLTSGCKSAAAQYKHRYYLAPPQIILTKQI